ncbi:MAG: hypothetical protein ABI200_03825 [Gaiellales bacterium]
MSIAMGAKYAGALAVGVMAGGASALALGNADRSRAAKVDAQIEAMSPQEVKTNSLAGTMPKQPRSLAVMTSAGLGVTGVAAGGVALAGAGVLNLGGMFNGGVTGGSMHAGGMIAVAGVGALLASAGAYMLSNRD